MKIKRLIEYGLYLLAFLLPLETRWIIKAGDLRGYSEYSTISLYGTDILLILLLIIFIIFSIKKEYTVYSIQHTVYGPWFFIAILELAAFVSIFFAADKSVATFSYLRLLLGIGLFWLVTSASYDQMKLAASLAAGFFIQAGLGIWQFLSQSTFASKWLGMASHDPWAMGGESVIETLGGGRWLRAYGGLDHPNILGGILVIIILMAIYWFLAIARTMYDRYKNEKDLSSVPVKSIIFGIVVFYSSLIIFASGLFFSFSRSAWLALAAGLFIFTILLIYKQEWIGGIQLLKVVITLGAVFFTWFLIYGNVASTRALGSGRLEDKSVSERALYYNDFKKVISNHWLAGVGMGNYTLAVYKNDPGGASYRYQPVHNVFLLVWSETGILGLLAFAGLFVYLIIKNFLEIGNWKLEINKSGNKASNLILSAPIIISLIVLLSLDHWLWSLHFGILSFWFIIGYSAADHKRHDSLG